MDISMSKRSASIQRRIAEDRVLAILDGLGVDSNMKLCDGHCDAWRRINRETLNRSANQGRCAVNGETVFIGTTPCVRERGH